MKVSPWLVTRIAVITAILAVVHCTDNPKPARASAPEEPPAQEAVANAEPEATPEPEAPAEPEYADEQYFEYQRTATVKYDCAAGENAIEVTDCGVSFHCEDGRSFYCLREVTGVWKTRKVLVK